VACFGIKKNDVSAQRHHNATALGQAERRDRLVEGPLLMKRAVKAYQVEILTKYVAYEHRISTFIPNWTLAKATKQVRKRFEVDHLPSLPDHPEHQSIVINVQ
jgi:hypothetical protein